jgi:hypothetical protein
VKALEFAGKVSAILAIIASIGSAFWYVALLEGRVRTLEERVHTLTVAPFIANSAEKTTLVNPAAQACADLAQGAVRGVVGIEGGVVSGV